MPTITVQEHLLPGDDLRSKWAIAERLGFDGIELRGGADIADRRDELAAAARAGIPMQSLCVTTDTFIGAFDQQARDRAVGIMKDLLSAASAIGARGAITPAAFGIHSNRLPPFTAVRTPEEDEAVLVDALGALGEHARAEGVTLWLEPLNRYEDHMVNTLSRGAELIAAAGAPSVKLMADVFHMNIEEPDIAASIRAAGALVDHVHLADSSRLEPGTGHTDFASVFAALDEIGFQGVCAIECRLSGDAETALLAARAHLDRAAAGRTRS